MTAMTPVDDDDDDDDGNLHEKNNGVRRRVVGVRKDDDEEEDVVVVADSSSHRNNNRSVRFGDDDHPSNSLNGEGSVTIEFLGASDGEDRGKLLLPPPKEESRGLERKPLERSLIDRQRSIRGGLQFSEHFSMRRPTGCVAFQGEFVYLYELGSSQVQIKISDPELILGAGAGGDGDDDEDDDDDAKSRELFRTRAESIRRNMISSRRNYRPLKVEVRSVGTRSVGATRVIYTIVVILTMATFVCASLILILFIFMDLLSEAGVTGGRLSTYEGIKIVGHFWATLLSIPVLLHGLSSILTVWVLFIKEIWNEFPFLRTIGRNDRIDEVVIEWVSLSLMVGVPSLTILIELFQQAEGWWETTMHVWYMSILFYFGAFAVLILFFEIRASYRIFHRHNKLNARLSGNTFSRTTLWSFVLRSIESTQNQMFCGFKVINRVQGHTRTTEESDGTGTDDDDDGGGGGCRSGGMMWVPSCKRLYYWYTAMTRWKIMSLFFDKVDPPEKLVSLNEVISNRQFLTRKNWTIGKGLSSHNNLKNVMVIRGKDRLKKSQIISSVVCLGLATVGALAFVTAFLLWFGFDLVLFLVISAMILAFAYPKIVTWWALYRLYHEEKDAAGNASRGVGDDTWDNGDDDGIYQYIETYRVSRPKPAIHVLLFLGTFGSFYAFPFANLILLGNWPVIFPFSIIALLSIVRYWFDPVRMLQDQTDRDKGNRNSGDKRRNIITRSDSEQQWKSQAQMSTILTKVTRSNGTKFYIVLFLMFIALIFTLAIGVIRYKQEHYDAYFSWSYNLTLAGDFVYHPKRNLMYPTCSLTSGVAVERNSTGTNLIDYAFLSNMIYYRPELHQEMLDNWFGPGTGKVNSEIIRDFRETYKIPELVGNYEIVTFGDAFSVVVTQGTSTAWDWLANAQLWLSVGLMEYFLDILPAGIFFHDILDEILKYMGFLQNKRLTELTMTTQLTKLVHYMRDVRGMDESKISMTGHSLGGGVTLVTGAQTNTTAIALSGPNSILIRKMFDPPLELDTINSMLFNIIPERDIVPKLDEPGLLNQKIACRAKSQNFLSCHSSERSICELMVNCGSGGRPPPCNCATRFGYEEPTRIAGSRTFSEVCGTHRSNGD